MADPSPYLNTNTGDDRSTPRWVYVIGIIAIVAVLLIVAVMLIGGLDGGHGPGRHTPSGDAGGLPLPASVPTSGGDAGHAPPVGGHTP